MAGLHRLAVLVSAFAAVAVLSSCGSSDKKTTSSAASTPPPAQGPEGLYITTIKADQLHVPGNPPAGLWRLQLTGAKAEFTEPDNTGMELTVKSLSPTQVTFAPDTSCEVPSGRRQDTVYRITKTPIGIRFTAVKASCPLDRAVLTAAEWRRA